MLRPSPRQPCRRAYPCSPPFTALRNARPCRIHPAGTALLAWPGCPPLTDCGSFTPPLSGPFDGLPRSALARLGQLGRILRLRVAEKLVVGVLGSKVRC